MDKSGLLLLAGYSDWANRRVLAGLRDVPAEVYLKAPIISHGTLHGLFCHLLTGQDYFLHLCQGRPVEEKAGLDSLAAVAAYEQDLARREQAYLNSASEVELARTVTTTLLGRPRTLPRHKLLLQGFSHAMHHRGELAILLGQMGHSLPTFDIIIWFMEQGA